MNSETKRLMAESIKGFRLPRYAEIPNVGLYLEQTTKYINGYLAPLGCIELTSSMVSNYVKKGLIPNPVKKQYGAEHIAKLFFIAFAKNPASMDNIALLFDIQDKSYPLDVAYDYMCDELENILFYIFELKDTLEIYGQTDTEEKDLLYSLIFASAYAIYMEAWFGMIRSRGLDNK